MGGAVAVMAHVKRRLLFDGMLLFSPLCSLDPQFVPPKAVQHVLR